MDRDRLADFIATEYPRVVAAVTVLSGDPVFAEEAVQEALVRACEKMERGVEISNLAAWVTTVAQNHTRNRFRRLGRERRAVDRLGAAMAPQSDASTGVERLVLRDALAQLPRRQRQAVTLRYLLGMDVKEVAREMGVAEGTAKALMHQARGRLAELLREQSSGSGTRDRTNNPDGARR